ncbi:hypothetical protein Tco_0776412 [Tanacetum coccineum]
MTMGEVNTRVTEHAELHEHDTQDLYSLLEDAQDSRSRISQQVDMDSQRSILLMGASDLSVISVCTQTHLQAHSDTAIICRVTLQFNHNTEETRHPGPELETERLTSTSVGLLTTLWERQISRDTQDLDETIETWPTPYGSETPHLCRKASDNKIKADGIIQKTTIVTSSTTLQMQNVAQGLQYGTSRKDALGGIIAKCTSAIFTTKAYGTPEVPQKGNGAAPKGNGCFEYGAPGNFKRDCPTVEE